MSQGTLDLTQSPYHEGRVGYKRHGTSEEAAKAIEPKAGTLRQQVLDAYMQHGPMTADHCARVLGLSILAIRPRVSELRKAALLFDTGRTAPNASGKQAEILTA